MDHAQEYIFKRAQAQFVKMPKHRAVMLTPIKWTGLWACSGQDPGPLCENILGGHVYVSMCRHTSIIYLFLQDEDEGMDVCVCVRV